MVTACPSPIQQDNFAEVWTYTDEQRRNAKKKYVTAKVAPFFSNLVFCLLTFLAANGLIHDHFRGSYCDFLEKIPYLLPLWSKFSGTLLRPGQGLMLQSVITLVCVYAVSFAVCGVFVLLVMGVYHPQKKLPPEGAAKESAEQMLELAKAARHYANDTCVNSSVLCGLLFSLLVFASFAFYWLLATPDMTTLVAFLTAPVMNILRPYITDPEIYFTIQMNLMIPAIMVYSLLFYIAYAVLSRLHGLSIQFMFRYRVPYGFVAQIEEYSVFCDEEIGALSPEEVEARHRAQAEEKRLKALELERYGAYGKARELLAEAAYGGDVPAMEHYARHWLILSVKDPARYWLERAIATGCASKEAQMWLKRLKLHRSITVRYLNRA